MPVPAPGQAQVVAGDADPLEVLWRREHPADELAVVILDPLAIGQRPAGLGDPVGEAVANRLQLPEVEDPRRGGDRVDPVGDLGVAEGLAEERRQLRLETRDLPPQLEPRLALVDAGTEPGELIEFQQSGHQQKL